VIRVVRFGQKKDDQVMDSTSQAKRIVSPWLNASDCLPSDLLAAALMHRLDADLKQPTMGQRVANAKLCPDFACSHPASSQRRCSLCVGANPAMHGSALHQQIKGPRGYSERVDGIYGSGEVVHRKHPPFAVELKKYGERVKSTHANQCPKKLGHGSAFDFFVDTRIEFFRNRITVVDISGLIYPQPPIPRCVLRQFSDTGAQFVALGLNASGTVAVVRARVNVCSCRPGTCADGVWAWCGRRSHAASFALRSASSGQIDCQSVRSSFRVTSPFVLCSNKTHIAGGTGLSPRIHWWTKLGAAPSNRAMCAWECFSAYSCKFMREL
jgi:hypothetical protein